MQQKADRQTANGLREIVLEHECREDFVGEALTFVLDSTDTLRKIEFYSTDVGVVAWAQGAGLGQPRRWEDETEVLGLSAPDSFTYHYPAMLLDGPTTDLAALAIVDRVLRLVAGSPAEALAREALARPQVPLNVPKGWRALGDVTDGAHANSPDPHTASWAQRLKHTVLPFLT